MMNPVYPACLRTMYLNRTGKDDKGNEKGYLQFPWLGYLFSTRENGPNRPSLRIGTYQMVHSIKRTHRKVQCLRPVEDAIQTMLIHDAYMDNPEDLTGCIAPGLILGLSAWVNSAAAMQQIWAILGGFQEGQVETLVVKNNVSYIDPNQTRQGWSRLNPPGAQIRP